MTRNGWIFVGSTAALAGAFALSLAQTPTVSAPATAVATPDVVSAPAIAVAPAPAAPLAVAPPAVTPAAPAAPAATPVSGIVPGTAGMVIAIDPETGLVGAPSSEQLAEMKLDENELVSREGGILVRHPNGMVSLDLQGRNQDYAVIKRTADGKIVTGCVQHPGDMDHTHLTPTELEEK